MADEDSDQRTLEASDHRINEAIGRGEWPVSDALALAFTWPLVAAGIALLLPWTASGMTRVANHLWSEAAFAGEVSARAVLAIEGPPMLAGLLGLVLVLVTGVTFLHLAQKGFVLKAPLDGARAPVPRLPVPGLAASGGKIAGGLARVLLAAAGMWLVLPREGSLPMEPHHLLGDLAQLTGLALVFGAADYALRRRAFLRSLMMTPAEARVEAKQLDGDPRVKGRIRQRAMRPTASSPFRTVLLTDGDAVAVVMLFEDAGQSPKLCLAARGEGGARLKEQYMVQEAPIVPTPGLAALIPSMRPMDPVPAVLHPVLAALHRELHDGGEDR